MIALKLEGCVTFDVKGFLFGCKSSCISDANFALNYVGMKGTFGGKC